MDTAPKKPDPSPAAANPTAVARETLHQLAARRIAPTPDNYRALYFSIVGDDGAALNPHDQTALRQKIDQMRMQRTDLRPLAEAMATALEDKSWPSSAHALLLGTEHLLQAPRPPVPVGPPPSPEGTERLPPSPLRDLLAHILESPIVLHLSTPLDMDGEARMLAGRVRNATAEAGVAADVRVFLARLERQTEDGSELRNGLFRLLRLLVDNIADLVPDDRWIEGQLDALRSLLGAPASLNMLREAEACLQEMLARQGTLRSRLREAKVTLKSMVETLIDRLGALSDDTGEYQTRIEGYSRRIETVDDIADLGELLGELLADTRHMQSVTQRSREDMIAARQRAEGAEQRVRELENELASVSTQVRQDQLTGTLNRRGFEEAFTRESARAQRHTLPLSAALLDIDNFKQLNDSLGHRAGDSALQHLVRVIRDTLRPSDVVCRFGGEEFLILLPETVADEGVQVIVRLQRELTRRFFLHNNEHVLITFSAGVTLWQPGENLDTLTGRADASLYEAKKAGKNRVCMAG